MKAAIHSNRGTEINKENGYPTNWPCTCGHRFDQHEGEASRPESFACIVEGTVWEEWADKCVRYKPKDNLSYIEELAKEKNL